MALTNAFFEAVNSGNVRRIRIMMKDSMLVDPTFREFKEMEKEARSVEGLYDNHDGREFIFDEMAWNDEYMDKLMVQVVGNFSHERIEHLKEVVRHLRPVAKSTHVSSTSEGNHGRKDTHTVRYSYEEQKHRDQQDGKYLGAKIATGAVAGAVVGGTIAAVAGVTVVGGVTAGAVVGGVAVTITTKGDH